MATASSDQREGVAGAVQKQGVVLRVVAPVVSFGVLGALDVRRDDAPVVVGSLSQRRLLSALLVHEGAVVSADRLADIVWSGAPPPSAVASLQTYVSRLRALLGPDVILTKPPGYMMDAAWVDAREFERLLRQQSLDEAIALWRGRPFAEFADEEWARPAVVRLEELHATARLQVEALLEASRVDEAVASAEVLCLSAPFRERRRLVDAGHSLAAGARGGAAAFERSASSGRRDGSGAIASVGGNTAGVLAQDAARVAEQS